MHKSHKTCSKSAAKYSLFVLGTLLSTTCFAEDAESVEYYLIHLHLSHASMNYVSMSQQTQPPIHLAENGRSRPEGVGGSRPSWGSNGGTRPEGVGGTRPEGMGGSRPSWGSNGNTRPEGVGGTRPQGTTGTQRYWNLGG